MSREIFELKREALETHRLLIKDVDEAHPCIEIIELPAKARADIFDHGERVPHLMRDDGRELADRRELLCLAKLFFFGDQLLEARRICLAAIAQRLGRRTKTLKQHPVHKAEREDPKVR